MDLAPSAAKKRSPWVPCFALGALFFVCLRPALLAGQEKTEEKGPAAKVSVRLVLLPLLFYEPETELAGGVGGLLTHRRGSQPAAARPSSMFFYAIYTMLGQFQAQAEPIFYFQGEDLLLTTKLTFELYPNKFWGVGDNTPDASETGYTPRRFAIESTFQRKLPLLNNLYVGVQYQLETTSITHIETSPPLPLSSFPGGQGGTVSGLGLILNWDTRNDVFTPSRGSQFQASFIVNDSVLGSGFDFTAVKADLREYVPGFFPGHAAAFQFLYQSANGTPPFYRYAMIGGDSVLRGYYKGRFRDNYLVVLQAEYRLPLWHRFGFVGFAGLGNVGPDLKRIDLKRAKYSVGFGLRYKLSREEGANVRVDLAFGKGSMGLYFTAGEAF